MNNQEAIEMLTAKAECIRREASGIDVDCNLRNCDECDLCYEQGTMGDQMEALGVAISALQEQEAKRLIESNLTQKPLDTISRQAVYDALLAEPLKWDDSSVWESARCYQWMMDMDAIKALPPAQPEIVRCKDCEYGEQDEVGRWFCSDLGCQIGSEDGSGFCADAERRTDG